MRATISPFVMSPLLGASSPRKPPDAWSKMYGSYCFRATCDVIGGEGGTVTGYDETVKIARDVEDACRLAIGKDSSRECGEASVVMLPSSPRTCRGEIFFILDGHAKRLV